MRNRRAQIAACGMLLLLGLGDAAAGQTAKPSPTPAPTPAAFSAQAHVNVTAVMQGNTFTGSAQLAVAQRADLTRIDVLSVKSDTFPVPPLSVTVVIDRRANTLTAWSDTTKQYRVQPFLPRSSTSPTPRATPSAAPASPNPRPAQRGTSPFAKLEVLDVSLRLTGHTTTAGLATTGLTFDLQVKKIGDSATSHVTATTQLADEFAAFPMTLDVSLEPGAAPFSAKASYAVDSLTRGVPALTRFEIPAGYTEAPSLMSVLFPRRPRTAPTPVPSASPRPT